MDELTAALMPVMEGMVNQLADKVYETLNYFLHRYYQDAKSKSVSTYKRLDYFTVEDGNVKKSICRKKLSTPFSEDNYNLPIIFYGDVMVEWDIRFDKRRLSKMYLLVRLQEIC